MVEAERLEDQAADRTEAKPVLERFALASHAVPSVAPLAATTLPVALNGPRLAAVGTVDHLLVVQQTAALRAPAPCLALSELLGNVSATAPARHHAGFRKWVMKAILARQGAIAPDTRRPGRNELDAT